MQSQRLHFSFGLALIALVVQPYISFWLLVLEGEPSRTEEAFARVVFFPSEVFDSLFLIVVHKSTHQAFGSGGFTELAFMFIFDAVVWAIMIGLGWCAIDWFSTLVAKHLTKRWS
jgi:hypothetical protein